MELLNLFKRSDGKPAQDRLIIVGGKSYTKGDY